FYLPSQKMERAGKQQVSQANGRIPILQVPARRLSAAICAQIRKTLGITAAVTFGEVHPVKILDILSHRRLVPWLAKFPRAFRSEEELWSTSKKVNSTP
ncbi:MAG: hypothetical protein ABSF76_13530, partial [Opitutaceae bacterium]